MRSMLILLVLIISLSGRAAAQTMCGSGLPCGPVPWPVPLFPALPSPTRIPTIAFTATPTPTNTPSTPTLTPTPTITRTPTITPTSPLDELNSGMETLSAGFDGTPGSLEGLQGTPINLGEESDAIVDNATIFFGYVRGVNDLSFGKISPLVTMTVFTLVIVISMKVITFFLPLASTLLSFIVRLVAYIIEYIVKAVRTGLTGGGG